MTMPHDIFISHSSKDKTIADAACACLEARGLRCWIAPRDIIAGACLLVSGLLFLVPGFVTDVLGILLLLPPVRGGLARLVLRHRGRRSNVRVVRATYSGPIVDVDVTPGRPSLGSSAQSDESNDQ